ncbi:MAG: DinB family protein [Meiothermus sp.]
MLTDPTFLQRFGDKAHCLRHLERSRRELLHHLETIPDEAFFRQPDPETWSVALLMEHVALAENSFARVIRRLRRVAQGEALEAVSVPAGEWREGKAQAPAVLWPKGGLDKAQIAQLLAEQRAFLLGEAEKSGELLEHPATFTHAFFGDLNGLGWLQTAVFHERHHLAQIPARLEGA